MEIKKNYNLKELNTFGVNVHAKFFAEVGSESELREVIISPEFTENKRFFLGGGSNILFIKDFDGIVIKNNFKGIEIVHEDAESVTVRAGAGEVWHDMVHFTVERGLWGIENLSLIPGTVGGAPVQNIGAYGAELKDTLENVEAYDIETGMKKIFSLPECNFGYRDSVWKHEAKGKYFITAVTLKLNKHSTPNTDYRVLKEYVEKNNLAIKTPKDVAGAVAEIRRSKLPDPKVLGNIGSFFKNAYVSTEKFAELLAQYPDMPHFQEKKIKIPAGWLIENAGWKGKRVGTVGVHEKQALVLVNYGGATAEEVWALAEGIIASVFEKFGIQLETEVNLIS